MIKQTKLSLIAKAVAGATFLAVFILNVVVFATKDDTSGGLTFTALNAFAYGEEAPSNYENKVVEDWTETSTVTNENGSCTTVKSGTIVSCVGTGNVSCTPKSIDNDTTESGAGC